MPSWIKTINSHYFQVPLYIRGTDEISKCTTDEPESTQQAYCTFSLVLFWQENFSILLNIVSTPFKQWLKWIGSEIWQWRKPQWSSPRAHVTCATASRYCFTNLVQALQFMRLTKRGVEERWSGPYKGSGVRLLSRQCSLEGNLWAQQKKSYLFMSMGLWNKCSLMQKLSGSSGSLRSSYAILEFSYSVVVWEAGPYEHGQSKSNFVTVRGLYAL